MIGIVLLCIFGATLLLVLVIMAVVGKGLEEYETRYVSRGVSDLTEMFFFVDGRQLLLLTIAIAIGFGFIGYLFNWFVGLLMFIVGFVAPFWGIKTLRQRRINRFNQQLVDALVQMSSAFRAGLSFSQAAENVAAEMPKPLGDEFSLFVKELKLGVAQETALQNMADRMGSEDLQLVVTATNIARKLGGNMAEMFETISNTIRERFRLEGRISSLTSQGKMQGWVVGSMPLVLGLVLNLMRPDLMGPMLDSTFGIALISAVAVMEILGILLIRKIVSIDV
jgi:tight adherence protein B